MRAVRVLLLFTLVFFVQMAGVILQPVHAQAQVLENPQAGSFQSGIGVISGWVCNATVIEIVIDNGLPLQAGYDTTREDTRVPCGDANNGFSLLWNWNLSGTGTHRLRAFANGGQFADVTFTVTTLGTEFLHGVSNAYSLANFPQPGMSVTVQWQESAQNFAIAGGSGGGNGYDGGGRRRLENPQAGSFQSGIGVISGWACEVTTIEIVIDDAPPLQAGYGTTREDTRATCDDANNGFSLLWNWNLSGPGLHRIQAFGDGIRFADITFTVTSLGTEFLRGASGTYTLVNFPQSGTNVTIQWQESAQNFALSAFSGAGAVLSVTPNLLAFGTVPANQSKDLAFTATNNGSATLAVTSITISPDSSPFFSLLPSTSFSLGAGLSQNVFVRLFTAPSASTGVTKTIPGTGKVNIASTGGEFSIELTGDFVDIIPSAASSVSPSRLTFGTVPVGTTVGLILHLANAGLYAPLKISMSASPPFGLIGPSGKLVDHGSIQLEAGISINTAVLFHPTSAGAFTGALSVFIDSDGNDDTQVFLSGTGS
jgi:hypothetical protein